jgi:hypothetical protein
MTNNYQSHEAKRFSAEQAMVQTIVATLEEYPDMAGLASEAVSRGVAAGARRLQRECIEWRDLATISLALLPPNRLSDGGRNLLMLHVAKALNRLSPGGACPIETDFLNRTLGGGDPRRIADQIGGEG